jgi:hypothetical protein
VVVAHVEGSEGNRKHVMRLRIACVSYVNTLLDPVEPHRQWRVAWRALMIFTTTKSSRHKYPLIENLPPLLRVGVGSWGSNKVFT